jgi:hypothetical protein
VTDLIEELNFEIPVFDLIATVKNNPSEKCISVPNSV